MRFKTILYQNLILCADVAMLISDFVGHLAILWIGMHNSSVRPLSSWFKNLKESLYMFMSSRHHDDQQHLF